MLSKKFLITSIAFIFTSFLVSSSHALPTSPSSDSVSIFKRTGPGLYMITTPHIGDEEMIYNAKNGNFMVYLKFGDGADSRLDAYFTYNPSLRGNPKDSTSTVLGKNIENSVLKPLVDGVKIQHVQRDSDKPHVSEWYAIYLGADMEVARASIAELTAFGSSFGNPEDAFPTTVPQAFKDKLKKLEKKIAQRK
ncbi:hypothetical protein BDQ17DRAFT_1438751 [Cyathus striatus]|nr:hypothetical protein BDQ17DRAFT_1438751 [Cyathus striatus]